MFKSFALLASASAYSRKEMGELHNSLAGMIDGLEKTYQTNDAYRVAKRASKADLTQQLYEGENGGFYNKYTDYYAEPCDSNCDYADVYGYSSATRNYYGQYCPS